MPIAPALGMGPQSWLQWAQMVEISARAVVAARAVARVVVAARAVVARAAVARVVVAVAARVAAARVAAASSQPTRPQQPT